MYEEFHNVDNLELLKIAKSGNKRAKEYFFEKNLNLCRHIIKKFIGSPEYDDLFGCAMYGLTKAYDSFDISLGYQFSTYAALVIKNEVRMCGRKIKKRKYMEISSDDTVYKNDIDPGREILLIDILESDIGLPLNKLEEIVEEEYLEDLRMSLDELQPRHKSILLDYYGGLSQKEVGKKYNTTQATICRIINREVKNLRVKFNSIELKEMRGK